MRRRLLRGVAAAAISVAVLVPGAAQPAQAQDTGGPPTTEVGQFTFTFLGGLLDRAVDGNLTPAEVAYVLGQVVFGVRDSGTRILAEIDADRVAGSVTALRDAMGYTSLMSEGPRDANRFFGLAMHAAHDPHDKLTFGSLSPATVDALGRVSMAGYDLYLSAKLNVDQVNGRPVANEALAYIVNEYLHMLDSLTAKLKPDSCLSSVDEAGVNSSYTCRAFDGTVETWRMTRTSIFSPWMVQRGEGAPWEEGVITREDEQTIAKLAMRNTILFDAFQAQINLLALRARLTP